MDQQQIIADLESRAKTSGVSMAAVCARAGIHPTTFSRWKLSDKNPEPIGASLRSLQKLDGALNAIESATTRHRDAAESAAV